MLCSRYIIVLKGKFIKNKAHNFGFIITSETQKIMLVTNKNIFGNKKVDVLWPFVLLNPINNIYN